MADWSDDVRETMERYETILENIQDAVYTLDAEGRITWLNRPAVENYDIGFTREELVGSYVSKVLEYDDIETAAGIIQRLVQDDEHQQGRCEVVIHTAAGEEIPCDLHLSLLPFEDGTFQGTVGVLRDIREQKQREQRLAVFNRALRHNLRNDMSPILGYADTLAESLEGRAAEKAGAIRERAKRLVDLAEKAREIEETLEGHDYVLAPVDVAVRVRDRVAAFETRYPAATFSVEGQEEQWALANETLDIAIDELLENAVEHTKAPHRVTASVTSNGERVAITVADDGAGIPEEEVAAIEAGVETPLQHATGLGLWFVRWLVDRYGGTLSFDRPEDGGNAVTISLQPATATA